MGAYPVSGRYNNGKFRFQGTLPCRVTCSTIIVGTFCALLSFDGMLVCYIPYCPEVHEQNTRKRPIDALHGFPKVATIKKNQLISNFLDEIQQTGIHALERKQFDFGMLPPCRGPKRQKMRCRFSLYTPMLPGVTCL